MRDMLRKVRQVRHRIGKYTVSEFKALLENNDGEQMPLSGKMSPYTYHKGFCCPWDVDEKFCARPKKRKIQNAKRVTLRSYRLGQMPKQGYLKEYPLSQKTKDRLLLNEIYQLALESLTQAERRRYFRASAKRYAEREKLTENRPRDIKRYGQNWPKEILAEKRKKSS